MKTNTASDLICAAIDATDAAVTPQQHNEAAICNRAAARAYMNRQGMEVIVRDHSETAEEHLACAQGKPEGPRLRARRQLVEMNNPGTVKNRAVVVPPVKNNSPDMTTPTYTDQEISDASSRLRVDATALSWQTGKTFAQCWELLRESPLYAAAKPQPAPPDPKLQNRDGAVLIQLNRELSGELKAAKRANPEIDYDAAMTIVRNRRPELFRFENSEAGLPEGDKACLEIERAIQRMRFNDPKLSYESARNAVRRAQPALFGL